VGRVKFGLREMHIPIAGGGRGIRLSCAFSAGDVGMPSITVKRRRPGGQIQHSRLQRGRERRLDRRGLPT
jgi:hypothetical protein